MTKKKEVTYNIRKIILYSNNKHFLEIHKQFFREDLELYRNLDIHYIYDDKENYQII